MLKEVGRRFFVFNDEGQLMLITTSKRIAENILAKLKKGKSK